MKCGECRAFQKTPCLGQVCVFLPARDGKVVERSSEKECDLTKDEIKQAMQNAKTRQSRAMRAAQAARADQDLLRELTPVA